MISPRTLLIAAIALPAFASSPYATFTADFTDMRYDGNTVFHFKAARAIALYDTNANGRIDGRQVPDPNVNFPRGNRIGSAGGDGMFCGDIVIYGEGPDPLGVGTTRYFWFTIPDPARTTRPPGCSYKFDFGTGTLGWPGDDTYVMSKVEVPAATYPYTRFEWSAPGSFSVPGQVASADWNTGAWPSPLNGFTWCWDVGPNPVCRLDNVVIDVPLIQETSWDGTSMYAATAPRAQQTSSPGHQARIYPPTATTLWSTHLSNAEAPPPDVWGSIHYADVNGDGRDDLCYRGPIHTVEGIQGSGIMCQLAMPGTIDGDTPADLFGPPRAWSTSFGDELSSSESYWGTLQFADLNGDGKADVCARYPDGIHCALSTGTSFGPAHLWTSQFSDASGWNSSPSYWKTIRLLPRFNSAFAGICGRGSAGIICAAVDPYVNQDAAGETFDPSSLVTRSFSDAAGYRDNPSYWSTIQFVRFGVVIDVIDVCARSALGIICTKGDGSGYLGPAILQTTQFSDARGWNLEQYYSTIRFADVNGDFQIDVCGRGSSGWWCAMNDGSSFEADGHLVAPEFADVNGWTVDNRYKDTWLQDVNGDTYPDICGRGYWGIYCAINQTGEALGHQWEPLFAPAILWIHDFGDSANWQSSPSYWSTIQPASVEGKTPQNGIITPRFCGRGDQGIRCSLQ